MENSGGEAVDDQGSGWFEVKKHSRRPVTNEKSRNSDGKNRSQRLKVGGSFGIHSEGAAENSSTTSNKDKKGTNFLDNSVVKQVSDSQKSPQLFVASSNGGNVDIQITALKDKPGVVQKIKWGDLEDDAPELLRGNSVGAEIKFGDIGHDNLVACRKHENNQDLASCISSCKIIQENQFTTKPGNVDSYAHKTNSLSGKDHISEGNYEEADKISSEDVGILIANEKVMNADDDASSSKEVHIEDTKPVNNDHLIANEELQVPVIASEVDEPKTSEIAVVDEGSRGVTGQGSESCIPEQNGPEISGDLSCTTSVDKDCSSLCATVQDDLSRAQSLTALGEDDSSESKERFRQRLWCFLFENLNRAVDELYLLCELECDLEQMKEAILVLEEAASDFKELTTRVEEFEIVKKSSSQSIDGAPITLKTDHRRPHALSWEVRRMTNSPHKAEILSSSLEAFKKIQQERASLCAANNAKFLGLDCSNCHHTSDDNSKEAAIISDVTQNGKDSVMNPRKQTVPTPGNTGGEKRNFESGRSSKGISVQNGSDPSRYPSSLNLNSSRLPPKDTSAASGSGKSKREHLGSETDKLLSKKEKILAEIVTDKNFKSTDPLKRQIALTEKDKEKRNAASWKSMDAWKEKRNWEDILSSPFRVSSRISHSPGMSRKSAERARILHDKLMTPEKKKKTALDLKKEAAEKHARAMRIRSELENERVQKLQRTSEKLNRVNEWQAVRTMKLREDMYARHQRSELRHEAFLAQVVRRAGDESSKVNEVRFITSLNEENKKLILRQKLHDSELRRAEKLQVLRTKQKEDIAREEAVLERRKLIEAEKLQRLAETQKKKEEAQVRREEERKASSAAREARAIEQLRRKEERAKAQQEEAELLAQKLAEKLSESEQRRKFYLEQIRERASMDFRDQSSPLLRRSINKEGQGRSTPINNNDDCQSSVVTGAGVSNLATGNVSLQHSLKRRIKRIRQRLMALKYEFPEPPVGSENAGIGYRTAVATARAKIGRWLQELQKLRQARKGAASIGLITAEMIKFLEGKDPELQASRQAGLLDFIASALPASHTSKPEACQVMIHLLKLLRVVLSVPSNRSYFLAQNLLPPIIPMLSAALENYIKITASLNAPCSTSSSSSKVSVENFESITEVLDGFLWTVATIFGHISSDEQQLQMRDGLLELLIAYQVIHRLRDLFALYDRPQVEGSPFPSSILLSISLLLVLTSSSGIVSSINWEPSPIETVAVNDSPEMKLAVSVETGYGSINNTSGDMIVPLADVPEESPLDESCKVKDSGPIGNDSEKKMNNSSVGLIDTDREKTDGIDESQRTVTQGKDEKHLADMVAVQKNEKMLNLKQPVAFLLSAISETGLVSLPSLLTSVLLQANNRLSSEQALYVLPSNFEEAATGVLKVLNNLALLDIMFLQRMLVGLLLSESLLLLGYFALFHPGNQAVLRWGHSPTILHKVCDLPFVFFSDPGLMPILAGTLVAACYGCEQNKGVVQQELSMDMLLSLLKSCRNVLPVTQPNSTLENLSVDDSSECNQQSSESRKSQGDSFLKSSRYNGKSARLSLGKGSALGNSMRIGKMRNQRDSKGTKTCEDMTPKRNPQTLMLHSRFPSRFIDKAEQFFSAEITNDLSC
ncbi:SCAPER N domain-containing protein [Citrus sinensis]|uniref:SCAPER N domain-containing protein n=1 Tax=Citrus sinensis TaxID=2711 RepID=A0ACB8LXM9_CITSI|nr:SCAPER N domain-containing protein [Citrus sinensis]